MSSVTSVGILLVRSRPACKQPAQSSRLSEGAKPACPSSLRTDLPALASAQACMQHAFAKHCRCCRTVATHTLWPCLAWSLHACRTEWSHPGLCISYEMHMHQRQAAPPPDRTCF